MSKEYNRFKFKHIVQLAAPHTWAASVIPVLISYALSVHLDYEPSILMTIVLLAICVLMQSSVNTFNDYFDFVKGLDTEDDDLSSDDSTLVFDKVNPKYALACAIVFLVIAFALGIYVIIESGFIPLLIAIVGAMIVVLYSGSKTPISSLPIGECVSGIVMGGLIPLACVYVLTDRALDWLVPLWSVPVIIGIALIMMTNNTCDIEKDEQVRRRTLPVLLGRKVARKLYHALVFVWIVAIIVLTCIFFQGGIVLLAFMLLACFPLAKPLLANPLNSSSRIAAMGQICSLNIALGAFYCIGILA